MVENTIVGRHDLRSQTLSPLESLAQSIGNIAPTATPTLVIPLVFGLGGNATWLIYLIATIGIILVAYNVNSFARRIASPGSLYAYTKTGLGPWAGLIAGWALLAAYVGTGAAVTGGFTNYTNVLLHDLLGVEIPPVFLIAAAVLGSWLLAYRDIQLSTRTTLVLEFASVGLILFILIATLIKAPTHIDTAQLHLEGVTADQIRLGLVLALFSFVGFESSASLGSEAKDPLRTIPAAIIRSAVSVGLFFVFASYVLVLGFHGNAETLDKSSAPLHVLADKSGFGALKHLIDLGAAISFFACTLASINAGARILFQLGRHGVFHSSLGSAHSTNRTPHIAITLIAVFTFIPAAVLAIRGTAVFDIFGWIGSFASYGFILAYILVSIAAPVYLYHHRKLGIGSTLAAAAAIVLLVIALAGNLYPLPDAPYSWLPYAFLAYLGLGALWFAILRFTSPSFAEDIRNSESAAQLPVNGGAPSSA
ncbi:APC family permease [Hyphomicrobium sp. MC1]|uniref:APC family permease n=1 Tax=Hyphomicrobium sp. (strain MC1) TaxID=717785 RepID=UPI000213EB63|nr:APC family permease [Hyphomicrobium sp. MC1]CCB66606.1 Amino acid permease-associated region [Hyphomicrobium sp. MC1]